MWAFYKTFCLVIGFIIVTSLIAIIVSLLVIILIESIRRYVRYRRTGERD